jgi:hypothetical protein
VTSKKWIAGPTAGSVGTGVKVAVADGTVTVAAGWVGDGESVARAVGVEMGVEEAAAAVIVRTGVPTGSAGV